MDERPPVVDAAGQDPTILCPRCSARFEPLCVAGEAVVPCPHCNNVTWATDAASLAALTRCGSCGELISPRAYVCRFCHEPVKDSERRSGLLDRIFRRQEETQFLLLRTNKIFPNPYQPREEIDLGSPEFEDLKKSVAAYGVLVPIIVSNREGPLVLVAGQRRLACCRQVGILKIPAIVRSLTPQQIIEISYLENLHRKNFSSVEMAQGFQRLRVEMAGLPAEELCRRIGRSPEAMKKDLEIAALPMILREAIKRGLIGEEHALKLRGIHDEVHLLEIIKRVHLCRLSVEDTDHLANPGRA